MFWMRPVAWGRWGLAGLLLIVAFVADVRGPAVERYPFAAASHPAGTPIGSVDVEWREVPVGVLPATELHGSLRVGVDAGTPLGPEVLDAAPLAPGDWWVVEVPLLHGASPGSTVRLVILDPATTVDGIVVAPPTGDAFSGTVVGSVAVPAVSADIVARALAVEGVVTLLSAGG